MISASGCIFIARSTGRICLQLRSDVVRHGGKWGFWGGKSEDGERPYETLVREINEELGDVPPFQKVHPINKFVSDDQKFEFISYAIVVDDEFTPSLNSESAGYAWVDIDRYPRPLHYGAKSVLHNPDLRDKLKIIVGS